MSSEAPENIIREALAQNPEGPLVPSSLLGAGSLPPTHRLQPSRGSLNDREEPE